MAAQMALERGRQQLHSIDAARGFDHGPRLTEQRTQVRERSASAGSSSAEALEPHFESNEACAAKLGVHSSSQSRSPNYLGMVN